MAEISRPVIAAGDAAVHSEISEMSAELNAAAESVSLELAMGSSPSLSSSLVPPTYNTSSSVNETVQPATASPTTLVASCSSTPPTPQSHGSDSSPGLHADLAVAVPPPPYSAQGTSAELTAAVTVPPTDQLVQADIVRSHLPPPPKKPLTPYMRFSKSIWQKVKAANQNFTVCEIGATIGRLWREMTDIDKQQYNDGFTQDKARYDDELQGYLKATGLQASDLVKAKVKKSKSVSGKAASYTSSPSHDAKPVVDSYSDTVNGNDVPGVYVNAANGLAAGSTLPHFSQVWSSTAQDVVYNADQLLAQMAGPVGNGQAAGLYHGNTAAPADAGVLLPADASQHLQPAVYHDAGQHVSSSTVSPATSQDQAAMTNWLWQQYAAAGSNTDQFVASATADSLQPNTVDAMTNGSVIVYQLNADGTQYTTNSLPASADMLEPGEVRLPVTTAQTNGIDQPYNNADYQLSGAAAPWLRQAGNAASTMDSEKQLLRGALVDKVREIQRLTRELEQAYALIHQLKQHNEFLHGQWGQVHVASETSQ